MFGPRRLLLAAIAIGAGAILLTLNRAKPVPPGILYLGWDAQGKNQVFWSDDTGKESEQLTDLDGGVADFAISGEGSWLAYSSALPGAGQESGPHISQLRLFDLQRRRDETLASCARASCSGIEWHPDGERLMFERREMGDDGIPGPPSLWWLTRASRRISPLDPGGSRSQAASFSPDGRWLAYSSLPAQRVVLTDLTTGLGIELEAELGAPVAWRPGSQELLFRRRVTIVLHGTEGIRHQDHSHTVAEAIGLFSYDLQGESATALGESMLADDSSPAYSPDGEWIAHIRRIPRTGAGGRLWLTRADGSDSRPLSKDIAATMGSPWWSPDGRFILYQRLDAAIGDKPGIWTLDVTRGQARQIIKSGYSARWLQR